MVNVAVPAASFTTISLITNCGISSSTIIAAALAGAGFAPLTGVAVRLKFSLPSAKLSSVIGNRSCTEVAKAGMVTLPATGAHVAPPSNDTSNVAAAPVSVPTIALPSAKLGVNTTGELLGLLKFTVNTA